MRAAEGRLPGSSRGVRRDVCPLPEVGHPVRMLDDFDGTLRRAREGEPEAFAAIYADLARPVAAYLRSRGVREVEDVTSDVFLAVLSGVDRFTGDQARFRSWVFTIAHRRMVDHWRRAAREPWTSPFEPEADTRTVPSAEAAAFDSLGTQDVLARLAELTEDQREVLALRVVADLTVEQVAEVMGKRPGAVKALQRRALAAVRRSLVTEGVPL